MCMNIHKNGTIRLSGKKKVQFYIRLSVVRAVKRMRLWIAQDGKCHYCQVQTTLPKQGAVNKGGTVATLDHIVTQSNGGTDSLANMVVACATCNNKRGDIEYNQFYQMMTTPGAWAEYQADQARQKAVRDEIRRQNGIIRHQRHIKEQQVAAQIRREEERMIREARIQAGIDKTARNNLIQSQAGKHGIKLLAAWINRANFSPRKNGKGTVLVLDIHPWEHYRGDVPTEDRPSVEMAA